MLGKTKISHQSDRFIGVFISSTQLSFQEPAGQGEFRKCGPSGYASPGPNLDSTALLIGSGPPTEQGVSLSLPLERF